MIMNWYGLLKLAAYEQFENQIEMLSRQNPYPFKEWFSEGQGGRIYIPFTPGTEQSSYAASDQEIIEVLQDKGCENVDFRKGYCLQGGRTFKIPKMLERIRKQEIIDLRQKQEQGQVYDFERDLNQINIYYNELLQQFINSPQRVSKGSEQFEVVISQNPHDVAKMSTDRGWTSCMELGQGSHHEDIFCEVQIGSLVAYLIKTEDWDIHNPLARIHIRRFENQQGKSIAMPEESVYGNEIPGFLEVVKEWISSRQIPITPGVYKRKGGRWSDTFGDELLVSPDTVEGVIDWLEGKDENAKYSTWTVNDELAQLYNEESESNYRSQDDKIEDSTQTFNTREEAEKYFSDVSSYTTEEEEWIRERLAEDFDFESWTRHNEDESDYAIPRYKLEEDTFDHTKQMKRDALKTILETEKGKYTDKVIKKIHDELFEGLGRDDMKKLFAQRYPELVTEEDMTLIQENDMLGIIRALPEEQRGPYKQRYYDHAMRALDDITVLYDSYMQELSDSYEVTKNQSVLSSLSIRLLGRLDSEVFQPIQELFKPIPEPLIKKMANFAMRALEDDVLGQYGETFLHRVAHTFGITKSDTPTVQKFYESILPYWGETHSYFGDEYNKVINVGNVGLYIAWLEENGKQFIPFIREKLNQEQQRLNDITSSEERPSYIKDTYISRKKMSQKFKNNIENYLYILESLENNGKRSGKYRFHH